MVYGFSVISAVSPAVDRIVAVSDLDNEMSGMGGTSGNKGMAGDSSLCLK